MMQLLFEREAGEVPLYQALTDQPAHAVDLAVQVVQLTEDRQIAALQGAQPGVTAAEDVRKAFRK